MTGALTAYVHDHLAGASVAINLLSDLKKQAVNNDVSAIATELLPAIEADRAILQNFANQIGSDSSTLKDVAAWVAQKASCFKFDLTEPFGIFEAIEALSLGVVGKLALWTALECKSEADQYLRGLDIETLKVRAQLQHRQLETERLKLATATL